MVAVIANNETTVVEDILTSSLYVRTWVLSKNVGEYDL